MNPACGDHDVMFLLSQDEAIAPLQPRGAPWACFGRRLSARHPERTGDLETAPRFLQLPAARSGPLLENFVVMEIEKQRGWSQD